MSAQHQHSIIPDRRWRTFNRGNGFEIETCENLLPSSHLQQIDLHLNSKIHIHGIVFNYGKRKNYRRSYSLCFLTLKNLN